MKQRCIGMFQMAARPAHGGQCGRFPVLGATDNRGVGCAAPARRQRPAGRDAGQRSGL